MSWAGQCRQVGPPSFTAGPLGPPAASHPADPAASSACRRATEGGTAAQSGSSQGNADSRGSPEALQEAPPPLLQCFVAAVVCRRRRDILDLCDGADAVFCLFGAQQLDFEPLLASALQLQQRLNPNSPPQHSFEELLSFSP